MDSLQALGARIYYGNSLERWAEAALIFLVLLTVLPLLRLLIDRRLKQLHPTQSAGVLELLLELHERTTFLFILAVSVYAALKTLQLPAKLDRFIDIAIQIAIWIQIALWAAQAARFSIDRRMHQVGGERLPTLAVLRFISLVLIWAVSLLLLLSNLGVNVTALATSLGIGGVAVALAVQNVLGDVLASLAIAFDKPYVIGDELHIDDIVGNVEHIGIKSTRLRSIDGEQIIIANGQMLQAKLKNFGRAPEQRIAMPMTLAFDSTPQTLAQFPGLIRQVIEALPNARLHHCVLRALSGAGFEFDVSFYATAPDKLSPIALREQFLLQLLNQLERHGIGFIASSPVLAVKPAPVPPAAGLGALAPPPARATPAEGAAA